MTFDCKNIEHPSWGLSGAQITMIKGVCNKYNAGMVISSGDIHYMGSWYPSLTNEIERTWKRLKNGDYAPQSYVEKAGEPMVPPVTPGPATPTNWYAQSLNEKCNKGQGFTAEEIAWCEKNYPDLYTRILNKKCTAATPTPTPTPVIPTPTPVTPIPTTPTTILGLNETQVLMITGGVLIILLVIAAVIYRRRSK